MSALLSLLAQAARHGRALLVLGLLAGVSLPGVALAMKPWLQELVALLLFLAALRVGPARVAGAANAIRRHLGLVLAFQVALPLMAVAGFAAAGLLQGPVAAAVVLMLAASPISGSPNLALLSGAEPAAAFRLLILGTALLPLTVIPVFALMPGLGAISGVLAAASRLLFVIALAGGAALALRRWVIPSPTTRITAALDGLSALVMAIVVVGLMSAVGPALGTRPAAIAGWLALALALNFGMQIAARTLLRNFCPGPDLAATAIIAGNRNIALFLVALPPEVSDRILLFIGCYQIPMYTTPLVMRRLYARPD